MVIEGVGHFPQIEAPGQFVDALIDFLETTEPAVHEPRDRKMLLKERSTPPPLDELSDQAATGVA